MDTINDSAMEKLTFSYRRCGNRAVLLDALERETAIDGSILFDYVLGMGLSLCLKWQEEIKQGRYYKLEERPEYINHPHRRDHDLAFLLKTAPESDRYGIALEYYRRNGFSIPTRYNKSELFVDIPDLVIAELLRNLGLKPVVE